VRQADQRIIVAKDKLLRGYRDERFHVHAAEKERQSHRDETREALALRRQRLRTGIAAVISTLLRRTKETSLGDQR